ncbi:MAG: enoyl-CoA hydratase/isomerase family protein [Nitrincola lacisaponensis]|uniref:enoyl-CoA hydratase/isomerase family protein n=1 Tax=Nitrincola lacisaponensis TaxID=267850 RepID=UPI00391B4F4D
MTSVIFQEHETLDGHLIGEICLNAPRTLNALSHEMIQLINPQLDQWQENPRVVALLLSGAGDKAFCAGGDVVAAWRMIDAGDFDATDRYFAQEYRLDYRLQTYPKPIVCWASGYVMGGGLGLMNGCSHRVVTETSRLAMPEVTIGLFPDVGASYFLNRLSGQTGLFMGLTASQVSARDACWLGLADYALTLDQRPELLSGLLSGLWNQGDNAAVITQVLEGLAQSAQPAFADMLTPIQTYQDLFETLLSGDQIADFVERLVALETEDPWLLKARETLLAGSPLSVCLIAEQLKRTRQLSLKAVFQAEMQLASQCCRQGEFVEGVRALLIDKDKTPKWRFKKVETVDPGVLESFFQQPWTENPLAAL